MRMESQNFVAKVVRGLRRDSHIGLGDLIRRGVSLASQSAAAKLLLGQCSSVGAGARVIGRVRIENHGAIDIGSGFMLNGRFMPVELLTGPGGKLEIGDEVWLNYGCVISARQSVVIKARAHMGPHCIVADEEVPEGWARNASTEDLAKPVEIGEDVWLAGRVTIMPGVKIGAGTVVTAGSIVQGDLPPGVVAGGIPARVLRSVDGSDAAAHDQPSGRLNGKKTATLVVGWGLPVATTQPVASPRFSGTVISDFTIDELADALASPVDPVMKATIAPFGQVTPVLLQGPQPDAADFAVVWTRIEGAIPLFSKVLSFDDVQEADLLAEVDAFTALVERAAEKYRFVFVPTWVLPPWIRGLGMLDTRHGGAHRALLSANLRLMNNLSSSSKVFVLNAERWFKSVGHAATNHRAWYMGKMAVPRAIMDEAASDIKAAIQGLTGGARKLLVVDLDDTLWGGIVGDVGWEGLRLGGHDPEGEAFVDFQKSLKSLKRRGIVLGIVSKNEESVALEAIDKHPEMVLRQEDFVGWKINWTDKARNISELAQSLNLGLQSVVFIDDNPVERARVREALPEVLVPEWPQDKLLYPSTLLQLGCFDTASLSKEDLERTDQYAQERQRQRVQQEIGSIEEWLQTLEMRVRAEPLNAVNLARSAQLLNKTNQLNLSTRRLSEAELLAWTKEPHRAFWAVSVSDRFGDAGLTGLVSIERDGDAVHLVDYVLSCRVMGRKVEETMLHMAVTAARETGARTLVAKYLPTPKNKPCLAVFQSSGFVNGGDVEFTWDLTAPYPLRAPIAFSWER
jgi:FkbH-like protein